MSLSDSLKRLPREAGVYLMKDINDNVIYVGKAKCLTKRVHSYFQTSVKNAKVCALVENIADIEYIITKSELDALSLENNLIKKHKPKYNVLLKDDKAYPYVKIDLEKSFPYFEITRKIKKGREKYFGPYMAGISVNDVLEILSMAFRIRTCTGVISENKKQRACLNYHIKKCGAPCEGLITKEEYRANLNDAISFLNGNIDDVENILSAKMLGFAENEEYELAKNYRDKLKVIAKLKEKRITALNKCVDLDIFAFSENNLERGINQLIIRKGIMLGSKSYYITDNLLPPDEIVPQFIIQLYNKTSDMPCEICVNIATPPASPPPLERGIDWQDLLSEFFKLKFEKNINITVPKQGIKKELCSMAERNITDFLDNITAKNTKNLNMTINACRELESLLNLPEYPKRIECFDISNISGTDNVGSMAVFIDGCAENKLYRRFKINSVEGAADDFKSHQEMMRRRLAKLNTADEINFERPDLMVIDGGKGQLSSCVEILNGYSFKIPIIALAEKNEEVFLPDRNAPLMISKNSNALKLLIRIRDEAHRFAVSYHKTVRNNRAVTSELNEIKGIGKKRRLLLIDKFKSIQNIKNAGIEELLSIKGIDSKSAENVFNYFNKGER